MTRSVTRNNAAALPAKGASSPLTPPPVKKAVKKPIFANKNLVAQKNPDKLSETQNEEEKEAQEKAASASFQREYKRRLENAGHSGEGEGSASEIFQIPANSLLVFDDALTVTTEGGDNFQKLNRKKELQDNYLEKALFLKDLLAEKAHSLDLNVLILDQGILTNASSSSAAAGILRSIRNELNFAVLFSNTLREIRNFVASQATGDEYTALRELITQQTFSVPTAQSRDFSDTRQSFPYLFLNLNHNFSQFRFKSYLFNLLHDDAAPLAPPAILNVKSSAFAVT